MTSARPNVTRHRHSAFSLRSSIQSNCRRCHSPLSGPLSYCWMCCERAAGVRWNRLAVHAAAILIPVLAALLIVVG